MVVDEELKMMSAVCTDGGRITGPHLKEMSRLTHTEYVLRGRSRLDPRDILRETMFAPTVTGSPMQNACTVITRHERTPRGYYSGVAALFTPRLRRLSGRAEAGEPTHDLDAPILIRTAYLVDGACGFRSARRSCATPTRTARSARRTARPPACSARSARSRATPPRRSRSTRIDEDAPRPSRGASPTTRRSRSCSMSRNARLASFWLNPQDAAGTARSPVDPRRGRRRGPLHDDARPPAAPPRPRRARSCRGARSPTRSSTSRSSSCAAPAPATRATRRAPGWAGCARSWRAGARRAGRCSPCASATRSSPTRSASTSVRSPARTRACRSRSTCSGCRHPSASTTPSRRGSPPARRVVGETEVAADPETGDVYALRGPGFASMQGHLESILSRDGMTTLERLVAHALASRRRVTDATSARRSRR